MRISDWSSDVCSSDLVRATGVDSLCAGSYKWLFAGWGVAPFFVRREVIGGLRLDRYGEMHASGTPETGFAIDPSERRFDYSSRAFGEVHVLDAALDQIGRASCRERVCQYV